jgi:hypothetical protein
MKRPELDIAAAEYALGILPSAEIPALADSLLDCGIVTPSAAELVNMSDSAMSDLGPLFEQMLREVGVPLPATHDATLTVLRDRVQAIVDAEGFPYEPLAQFSRVFMTLRDWIPDSSELWELYGAADGPSLLGAGGAYKGTPGEPGLRRLGEDARAIGESWLAATA